MMHNDIAVPLEDIYIEKTSPKITTPIPCAPYLLCDVRYHLFTHRLVHRLLSVISLSTAWASSAVKWIRCWRLRHPSILRASVYCLWQVSVVAHPCHYVVREDVCESLFKHGWGLMQSEDQLNHIVDFCWSNYDGGVKKRVCYKDVRPQKIPRAFMFNVAYQEFPTQPSYTYILLYNEKHGQLHLPNGQPCISGQTRVSTTLHPLLAVVIAMDFAVFNFKWNFEDPIHDSLLALGRCMTRPLWLSWFQDRPRPQFTTIRPQAKAIRDLAMHL